MQKTVSEVQKRGVFLILHCSPQANGGGTASLPGYATETRSDYCPIRQHLHLITVP